MYAGAQSPWFHGNALMTLAEVSRAAGVSDEAAEAARAALALFERKGEEPGAASALIRATPSRAAMTTRGNARGIARGNALRRFFLRLRSSADMRGPRVSLRASFTGVVRRRRRWSLWPSRTPSSKRSYCSGNSALRREPGASPDPKQRGHRFTGAPLASMRSTELERERLAQDDR